MNRYLQDKVVTFQNTDEEFGGLSNLSEDYPMRINGMHIVSSEHLYQSLKFPDFPSVQHEILEKPKPLISKMIASRREYKSCIRSDWEAVKVQVMDYCLKAKLINNWVKFGNLLRSTGDKDIVEITFKKHSLLGDEPSLVSVLDGNNLGRLLTTLRNEYVHQDNENLRILVPPPGLGLKLNGHELLPRDRRNHLCQVGTQLSAWAAEMRP